MELYSARFSLKFMFVYFSFQSLKRRLKVEKGKNYELKRCLEAHEDAYLCCVCMDRKECVVLIPCGHMSCDQCLEKIEVCPQCRSEVVESKKAFPNFGGHANSAKHSKGLNGDCV